MKITVLGSGTYKPDSGRYPAALALQFGNETILIDTGSGTFMQLHKASIDYTKINYILLTHLHIDHVSDLLQYIWAYNCNERPDDLHIICPAGAKKVIIKLITAFPSLQKLPFKIRIQEVKKDILGLHFTKIKTQPIKHVARVHSVAYRFESENKAVTYSGDCVYDEHFIKFCKSSDLLILECGRPNEAKDTSHLVPKECGMIAKKSNAKKLLLVHMYPICEKYDIKRQCSQIFKGKIIVAKDLMKIKV